MTKGLGDNKTAAAVRDVMRKIAASEIDLRRPDIRIGTVFSYDRQSQTAYIMFPGNDQTNLVPVRFGLDKIPSTAMEDTFETDGLNAVGDIVRVAGKAGALFILDYVTGAPQSQAIDLAALEINVKWAEETIQVPSGGGSFYADLAHTPLDLSETLHWNWLFQPRTEWTRNLRALKILDPDTFLKTSDKLTYRYMYEDTDFTPVITYDSMPLVGTSSRQGTVGAVTCPLPAGAQQGDLLLVAATAGISVVSTDGRLKGGTFGGSWAGFWYGYMTESTAPLTFTMTSGISDFNDTVVCVAYRGLDVDSAQVINTGSPTFPAIQSPSINAEFAVALVAARNTSFVAGTGIYQGNYTTPTDEDLKWVAAKGESDYKAATAAFQWFSKEGPIQSPQGNFYMNGSSPEHVLALFKLRAKA